ncbi:MAG: chromate efflux transporter [Limisphaerales bacterium]
MVPQPHTDSRARRVTEVALLFFRLGLTAFGGPAAHIAMLEDETVRRRGWLTSEEFLDLLGATNLIPGPNSTEMAIHIGYRRAGWMGWAVAGVAFIVPAVILVTGIAWAYVRFGQLPRVEGLLHGVKPVIVAIVLQALWSLGGKAVKNRFLAWLGVAAAAVSFFGGDELAILLGAALVAAGRRMLITPCDAAGTAPRMAPMPGLAAAAMTSGIVTGAATAAAAATTAPFGLAPLFLVFLKIGSVLFGSGYVLLAFLRADLVEHRGWLTEAQLIDAVAVGQFTPGPVFTAATFVGYLLGGIPGAVVATVGIFLPAFFFVAVSGPLVPRLRASPIAGAVLDGVNVASLALMAVVTWQLGRVAVVDMPTLVLTLVAGVLLFRYRVNSAWLVLGGGLLGWGFGGY